LILYIHGFRTTYDSYIATLLKNNFNSELISSDHSHIPSVAINQMENIIKKKNITAIIASSIGGYYATYLANKFNIKAILINPSVKPYITTKKYIGTIEKNDGTSFLWKDEHLNELKNLWVENLNYNSFFVFLKTGDNILDYKVAKERYKHSKILIEDDGDHRFSDLEKHIEKIKDFI